MAQVLVSSLKIVDGTNPTLIVNGAKELTLGDDLGTLPGLRGSLDRPFFEVLLALARRCAFGPGDGTASAEALVLDVRHLSAESIRRLFLHHLTASTEDISADGTLPLVAFVAPRSHGRRGRPAGGPSKGPYRLMLPPSAIDVSPVDGAPVLVALDVVLPPEAALDAAKSAVAVSDYLAARNHLLGACASVSPTARPADRILLARLWNELAYVEMELGLSRLSAAAAQRAESLVSDLPPSRERAQAWLVHAHALGQLGDAPGAELHARNALSLAGLGRAPGHLRRTHDIRKIELFGVWGQYLSRSSRCDEAQPFIEAAWHAATEIGDRRWAQTWLGRLAENELQRGRVAAAEPWLARAAEQVTGLPVSTSAFLTRLLARFMVAAQRWDEAARWLSIAYAIGADRSMRHQLALLDPLRAHPEVAARLGWPS